MGNERNIAAETEKDEAVSLEGFLEDNDVPAGA